MHALFCLEVSTFKGEKGAAGVSDFGTTPRVASDKLSHQKAELSVKPDLLSKTRYGTDLAVMLERTGNPPTVTGSQKNTLCSD
jgi:hypothetical protein